MNTLKDFSTFGEDKNPLLYIPLLVFTTCIYEQNALLVSLWRSPRFIYENWELQTNYCTFLWTMRHRASSPEDIWDEYMWQTISQARYPGNSCSRIKTWVRRDPCNSATLKWRNPMWNPEQETIACMKLVVKKLTKPGDRVMNPFSGTFSVAHACMLLSQHWRFVRGDDYFELVIPAKPPVVLTFATKVLKKDCGVTGY